jgi:hypothetical protein
MSNKNDEMPAHFSQHLSGKPDKPMTNRSFSRERQASQFYIFDTPTNGQPGHRLTSPPLPPRLTAPARL